MANNEKSINEIFAEAEEENSSENENLPEAPASANLKVWIDGFGVMFTTRGTQVGDVVKKTIFLIEKAKSEGWKPTWRVEETPVVESAEPAGVDPDWIVGTEKPTTEALVCAIHNQPMAKKVSQKTGNPYYSHSFKGKICFGEGFK